MSTDAVGIDRRAEVTERSGVRSQADGGIIAELRLDHADLLVRRTMERAPDVTIEPEYWTSVDDGLYFFFAAYSDADAFGDFEDALEADPTVAEPVLVDRYPDRRIYRVRRTERTISITPKVTSLGGRVLETTSRRDGWVFQLRLPDRDALVALNDFCRDRGISLHVNHLRTSDDGEDGVVGLTPKQQELLSVAFDEGYFDVPRGISQDELADRLGVSKSAISQRLRRAIAELCATSLA